MQKSSESRPEGVARNWLDHELGSASLERSLTDAAIIIDADHDDRQIRGKCPKVLDKGNAVELRHVHVEDREIKVRVACLNKSGFRISERHRLAAEKLDVHPHDEQASSLVVNDKNSHRLMPRWRSAAL